MTETEQRIERVARAICVARGLNPDALHQSIPSDEYPIDERRAGYHGVEMVFHRGWRRHVAVARGADAISFAAGWDAALKEVSKIVRGNIVHEHFREWPEFGPGNAPEGSERVEFADCMSGAILVLRLKEPT